MSEPIPLCDCCCVDDSMAWVGIYHPDTGACSGSFVEGFMDFSPTGWQGISPGWVWDVSPGKLNTCNLADPPPPVMYLRTLAARCVDGVWAMEWVVVFNNGGADVQDSFATAGGTLNAAVMISSSPLIFQVRTNGDGLVVDEAVSSGYYEVLFRVRS